MKLLRFFTRYGNPGFSLFVLGTIPHHALLPILLTRRRGSVLSWLEGSKDRCPAVRGDFDRKGRVKVDQGLSGQRPKGIDGFRGNKCWGCLRHGRNGDLGRVIVWVGGIRERE